MPMTEFPCLSAGQDLSANDFHLDWAKRKEIPDGTMKTIDLIFIHTSKLKHQFSSIKGLGFAEVV